MRIVGLNIRHGARGKLDELVPTVEGYGADVFVFGEYHANQTGEKIKEKLSDIGFKYSVDGGRGQDNDNGVAIFSRIPFEVIDEKRELGEHHHKVVEVSFERFKLIGVYFPNKQKKKPVFEYLMEYCENNIEKCVAIVGDYNTCKAEDMEGGGVPLKEYMYKFEELGWFDGWRKFHPYETEFSWYSKKRDGSKNGFRLDHLICTPYFAQALASVEYDHKPREEGFTDHSALIIDLNF